jgi:hypothetical protein
MSVSQQLFRPTDESYDEQEARRLFETALRSSRIGADQATGGVTAETDRRRKLGRPLVNADGAGDLPATDLAGD